MGPNSGTFEEKLQASSTKLQRTSKLQDEKYRRTAAGARAVLGSQRVRLHWQRGIDSNVISRRRLLRAPDGSRSVREGRFSALAAVLRFLQLATRGILV